MSYEIFEKKKTRIGLPAVTVNPLGRIYFNQEAADWLRSRRAKQILLLWSRDALMVGVQAAKASDSRAYRLNYHAKGGGASITAKSFLNWIGFIKEGPSFTSEAYCHDEKILIEFDVPLHFIDAE